MFKSAISAFILATSFSFVISTTAQAADLSHDMHQLKSGYKAFGKAGNAAQALAGLNQMQQAAQSAKQATPEGVDPSNTQQVAAYQDQLNQLSATISAANDLVQAGKLVDAKALGKKMLQIRDSAHEQFR